MNLVSLKNIDIWPRYGSKWPSKYHSFFGHNSVIDCPIGLKFFMLTQREKKIFLAGKMGVAAKRSGASRPDKKFGLEMGGPFGPTVISKTCVKDISAGSLDINMATFYPTILFIQRHIKGLNGFNFE